MEAIRAANQAPHPHIILKHPAPHTNRQKIKRRTRLTTPHSTFDGLDVVPRDARRSSSQGRQICSHGRSDWPRGARRKAGWAQAHQPGKSDRDAAKKELMEELSHRVAEVERWWYEYECRYGRDCGGYQAHGDFWCLCVCWCYYWRCVIRACAEYSACAGWFLERDRIQPPCRGDYRTP